MFGLTPAKYSSGRRKQNQMEFGGYDHNHGARDGTIWDMWNMSCDRYPLITARKPRYQWARVEKPNGMYIRDCVCWVDGTGLYVDGAPVGQVIDGPKRITGILDKIIIFPDKMCYDRTTGELKSLEASWTGTASFGDGTYAGITAAANTITAEGISWADWFAPGDAVEISQGDGTLESGAFPIGPIVIREIEENKMRFFENSFPALVTTEGEITIGTKLDNVTIKRTVPEFDFVFEHMNRLWGCKGDMIYASKQGDPTNWNVFDGISTDSWQLQVGSAGDFTGACSYGGRPIFFKEHSICRIYGDEPGEYQTYERESLGVEEGSGDSLAVAGETLFYKSKAGIMAYSGSYPRSVAQPFGGVLYRNAVAGSDGTKYYVSMEDYDGGAHMFVYDTRYGLWHKEDMVKAIAFGRNENLYFQEDRGMIWLMGDVRSVPEGAAREEGLSTMVEFGDWTEGSTQQKGVGKLTLRLWVEPGVTVTVKIQYDSDGVWHTVKTLEGDDVKQTFVFPLRIKRCDHYRVRIEGLGFGGWTLFDLTRDRYIGSDRK